MPPARRASTRTLAYYRASTGSATCERPSPSCDFKAHVAAAARRDRRGHGAGARLRLVHPGPGGRGLRERAGRGARRARRGGGGQRHRGDPARARGARRGPGRRGRHVAAHGGLHRPRGPARRRAAGLRRPRSRDAQRLARGGRSGRSRRARRRCCRCTSTAIPPTSTRSSSSRARAASRSSRTPARPTARCTRDARWARSPGSGALSLLPDQEPGRARRRRRGPGRTIPTVAARLRRLRNGGQSDRYRHEIAGHQQPARRDAGGDAARASSRHLDGVDRAAARAGGRSTSQELAGRGPGPAARAALRRGRLPPVRGPPPAARRARWRRSRSGASARSSTTRSRCTCSRPSRPSAGRPGDFPVAERAAREILSLPLYPELTDEQALAVAAGRARGLRSPSWREPRRRRSPRPLAGLVLFLRARASSSSPCSAARSGARRSASTRRRLLAVAVSVAASAWVGAGAGRGGPLLAASAAAAAARGRQRASPLLAGPAALACAAPAARGASRASLPAAAVLARRARPAGAAERVPRRRARSRGLRRGDGPHRPHRRDRLHRPGRAVDPAGGRGALLPQPGRARTSRGGASWASPSSARRRGRVLPGVLPPLPGLRRLPLPGHGREGRPGDAAASSGSSGTLGVFFALRRLFGPAPALLGGAAARLERRPGLVRALPGLGAGLAVPDLPRPARASRTGRSAARPVFGAPRGRRRSGSRCSCASTACCIVRAARPLPARAAGPRRPALAEGGAARWSPSRCSRATPALHAGLLVAQVPPEHRDRPYWRQPAWRRGSRRRPARGGSPSSRRAASGRGLVRWLEAHGDALRGGVMAALVVLLAALRLLPAARCCRPGRAATATTRRARSRRTPAGSLRRSDFRRLAAHDAQSLLPPRLVRDAARAWSWASCGLAARAPRVAARATSSPLLPAPHLLALLLLQDPRLQRLLLRAAPLRAGRAALPARPSRRFALVRLAARGGRRRVARPLLARCSWSPPSCATRCRSPATSTGRTPCASCSDVARRFGPRGRGDLRAAPEHPPALAAAVGRPRRERRGAGALQPRPRAPPAPVRRLARPLPEHLLRAHLPHRPVRRVPGARARTTRFGTSEWERAYGRKPRGPRVRARSASRSRAWCRPRSSRCRRSAEVDVGGSDDVQVSGFFDKEGGGDLTLPLDRALRVGLPAGRAAGRDAGRARPRRGSGRLRGPPGSRSP